MASAIGKPVISSPVPCAACGLTAWFIRSIPVPLRYTPFRPPGRGVFGSAGLALKKREC